MSRPPDLSRIPFWEAAELSVAIRQRQVSCREVMEAHLDHIDRVNPRVNAIVNLRPRAELVAEADEKDALLAAGTYEGWMHGFPHAVKDLADVKGLTTTSGFFRPPFDVPPATADSLVVERIRAAGAIFIGKTNTPEFGLGSHTYNEVFGTTLNAFDQTRSAGGSSGGAAVAVALRMVPVADGSDFFGSLRNPPGWNDLFGLRPSFGRVPGNNADVFVHQGGVEGPIARTARDLSLLLRTMAGYDARAPLSIDDDGDGPEDDAADPALDRLRGRKVAWMGDLGGYLPMEPEVLSVCRRALRGFTDLGLDVEDVDALPTAPGFAGTQDLWPTWLVLRHWLAGGNLKPLHDDPTYRAALKPEAIYEIEGLLAISALDVYDASVKRTAMYQAFRTLFETYDYVVLPTAQLFPFDADQHWPREIEGTAMSSYHRWMEVTSIGTLISAPTLAVPAGFSSAGLPMGLQIIGRNHDDWGLMELAHGWDRVTASDRRLPPLLNSRASELSAGSRRRGTS